MTAKLQKIQDLMQSLELDGVFLAENSNILFYSGLPITKSAVNPVLDTLQQFNPTVLYIGKNGQTILFSSASLSQYLDENLPGKTVYYYPTNLFIDFWNGIPKTPSYDADIGSCIRKFIGENALGDCSFGCDKLFYSSLGNTLQTRPALIDSELERLRFVKSADAVEKMRIASSAAYEAVERVQKLVEAGGELYEDDLFYLVRQVLLSHKCQWNFTTVACGPYSADIFHQPLHYRLRPGDAVRLDIGAVYENYGSDIAKTFFYPAAKKEFTDLYRVICEAQELVLAHLKPGAVTSELFHLGQNYVREHGYPQYTRTMIGHGVGIETEENPFLCPGGQDILEEGMVMSIELPYYIKGLAGLNTEDIVLITKDGTEYLR